MRHLTMPTRAARLAPAGHRGLLLLAAALPVVAAAALALAGHWGLGAGLFLITVMTLISLWTPLASLGALLLAAYLPEVLLFAIRPAGGVVQSSHSGSWGQFFGGLQLTDIVLVGMFTAVCLIVLRSLTTSARARARTGVPLTVWLPAALFAVWMGIEVARNVRQFGAAAPGEFRFEYLGLAVVPYLCVVARDTATQRRMLWLLLFGTLFVPLALVPVIGALKGWYVGPSSRFFPADVSLGIFFGAGALVLAKARRVVSIPTWLVGVVVCLAGILLFVDGNRSAWMAAIAAILIAVLLRAFPRRSIRSDGVAVGVALCAALVVSWVALAVLPVYTPRGDSTSKAHSNPLAYMQTRGRAYVNPSADPDSEWRLAVWRSALRQIRAVPVVGVGLGGYWHFSMPRSINNGVPVTVQPHNFYLETWLKTGGVGLLLYLASVASALAYLWRTWVRTRASGEPAPTLLLTIGVIVLCSSSLYMVAYPLSQAPLLWTGLALGAAALPRGSAAATNAWNPIGESDCPT